MTKTNGKATEIASVHFNWWSELPCVYCEELAVVIDSFSIIIFQEHAGDSTMYYSKNRARLE